MKQKLTNRISKLKNFADIKESKIDMWLLDLRNICAEERELSAQILDKKEKKRAASFSFISDRDKFTVCRSLSKIILSSYCFCHPAKIQISYGTYGKPYLPEALSIHFNISHTHNWGIICVSRENPVGVDIEYMDEAIISHDILTIFSSKEEQKWVYKHNIKERFFALFTSKEALLKAQGVGFLGEHLPNMQPIENGGLDIKEFRYGNYKIYSKLWNKDYIISVCAYFSG